MWKKAFYMRVENVKFYSLTIRTDTCEIAMSRELYTKDACWLKASENKVLFHFVERYKTNGLIFYALLHCNSNLHFYTETAKVLTQMSPASDLHRLSRDTAVPTQRQRNHMMKQVWKKYLQNAFWVKPPVKNKLKQSKIQERGIYYVDYSTECTVENVNGRKIVSKDKALFFCHVSSCSIKMFFDRTCVKFCLVCLNMEPTIP